MGNTSRAFFVTILTFVLPLIIFLNLMAFGKLGGFADLGDGEYYFGVSSFFKSINLFDDLVYQAGGELFTMTAFENHLRRMLNDIGLGLPTFFSYTFNVNNYDWGLHFDLSNFPIYNVVFGSFNDIITFFSALANWFVDFATWLSSYFSWFADGFSIYFQIFSLVFKFVAFPIVWFFDALYLVAFLLVYLCVFLMWLIALWNGAITNPLPSSSENQWTSIVDEWTSQWQVAKTLFAPL